MFLDNSRYARIAVKNVRLPDGRIVRAIALRRLPVVGGAPTNVTDEDRLDVIAQRRYGEPTWFWHIADANAELEARALCARPRRIILVPET
jgi:hypothetical protein